MSKPRIKNQLIIILDTHAENPIQIGKTEAAPPSNKKDMEEAMKLDFSTVREALLVLINHLDSSGIQDKNTSVQNIVNTLNEEFPGLLTVGQ